MATSSHRDPRSIITPDAFEVSDDLIGTPLAPPRRRLMALMIDGAVIGLITLVTSSFALILGVVAAIFFVRVGFKRTPVKGNVFGRAMRMSVGCLGLFIAIVTAIAWSTFGVDFGGIGSGTTVSATIDELQFEISLGSQASPSACSGRQTRLARSVPSSSYRSQ